MKLRRRRGGSEEEVVRVMQSENWTCSNAGWRRLQRPPFPPTPSPSYMISPSLLVDCNNYCTLVLGLLFGCHLDYCLLYAYPLPHTLQTSNVLVPFSSRLPSFIVICRTRTPHCCPISRNNARNPRQQQQEKEEEKENRCIASLVRGGGREEVWRLNFEGY